MAEILDATQDLRELTRLAGKPEARDRLLGMALDSLQALVPHDLAAILVLEDGVLRVKVARGKLAGPQVQRHSLDLERFPTIQRVLATRRPAILQEHHHDQEEGDPYDGILDLPSGHSCMVVPLYSAERPLGVMTFDRTVCGTYDERTLELADVYGQIISLAFQFAEQAELLDRYRMLLDERNRVLAESTAGRECRAVQMMEASRSPRIQALVRQARQVALTTAPVLITGQTGTGKEILARALHCWSPRAEQVFLTLNCAAIPEQLIESELFGHVKGAFSGADQARPGRFLAASGGTLLLDEIGDMPLAAQAKLLRVLQEGAFEPVGADRTVKVDVRILAATHRDLRERVKEGSFREDLFYRLEVFPLHLPSLDERPEDLEPLAEGILDDLARRTGRGPWTISPGAMRLLREQQWPGNIRQLVNTLERATILKPRGSLEILHVTAGPGAGSTRGRREPAPGPQETFPTLTEIEAAHIRAALARCGGRIYGDGGAARLLGLKPTTLQSRMKKLGVVRESGR